MTVGELNAYLNLDDRDYNRKLDSAEGKFRGFGTKVGGMSAMVGKVAMGAAVGGVAALGAGLIAGGVAGMKFNSAIQQTTIAMGTMLGSTAKAKTLIAEVTKMAAATPFEFPELADATKRLVAYGVSARDAVPLMRRLGDVSSALGVPIGEMADLYGKMKVSGRITMEDINQMAGRGVPIYGALAKTLGVAQSKIRGLVEEGKVGFPDVQKAFEGMTGEGSMFGGMMDKQSRSFAGLWSTLKDGVTAAFGKAIKPLFQWLVKSGMPAVIKAIPSITSAFSFLSAAIASVVKFIVTLVGWFNRMPTWVKTFIIAFTAAFAGLLVVLGAFVTLAPLVGKAWLFMTGPVGIVIAAVAAVVAIFVILWKRCDWFRNFWLGLWENIREVAQAFWDWAGPTITAAADAIWQFLKQVFAAISDWIRSHWDIIKGVTKTAWGVISGIVKAQVEIIKVVIKAIGVFVGWIRQNWDTISSVTRTVWGVISGIVRTQVGIIKGVIKGVSVVVEWVRDTFGKVKTIVGGAWDWVKEKTSSVWERVTGTIRGFVGTIGRIINTAFGWAGVHVNWDGSGGGGAPKKGPTSAQSSHPNGDPSGGWDRLLGDDSDARDLGGKGFGGKGRVTDLSGFSLPTPPSLPGPLKGVLPALVKQVWEKIKKMVGSVFSGGASVGGAGYGWATALAQRFGLVVSSTYRPGAITASGNISDHGTYGRAADIAGPTGLMGALWEYIKSTAGSWKQAIFQHQILNYGKLGYYAPSDHFDHVHLARNYSPGMSGGRRGDDSRGPGGSASQTLVHNHIYLDGEEIAAYLADLTPDPLAATTAAQVRYTRERAWGY